MRTLAELGDFLGIPRGSLHVARFGGIRPATLHDAGLLVTSIPEPDRRSLAALLDAVARLPELTVSAKLDGPRSGATPFVTRIRVSPAVGATWWTTLFYVHNGQVMEAQDISPAGGAVTTSPLAPGSWTLSVERAGVGPSGPVHPRDPIEVTATGPDQRKRPDDPPDPPPPDTPTCAVSFVTFQGQATQVVRVSGRNFAAREELVIIVDDDESTNTRTDGTGAYAENVSLPTAFPEKTHQFRARSVATGKTSNTFEYKA